MTPRRNSHAPKLEWSDYQTTDGRFHIWPELGDRHTGSWCSVSGISKEVLSELGEPVSEFFGAVDPGRYGPGGQAWCKGLAQRASDYLWEREHGKCEWPATVGAEQMCDKQAVTRAYSDPGDLTRWSRRVCGVHGRVAERRGWFVSDDPLPETGES